MPTDPQDSTIQSRLAALDGTFNTNREFGFMGYLNNQDRQAQPTAPTAPTAATPVKDDSNDLLLSQIRDVKTSVGQELSGLRQQLTNLAQTQPVAPQEQQGEIDPVIAKLHQVEGVVNQTALQTEFQRAQDAVRRARESAKERGEEFYVGEELLRNTWDKHIGNSLDNARKSNWDQWVQQEQYARERPKLISRLQELETAQPARNPLNEMATLPRSNRSMPTATNPAASGDFDENVYQDAAKQMGRFQFRGFNEALFAAQQRKLLRAV